MNEWMTKKMDYDVDKHFEKYSHLTGSGCEMESMKFVIVIAIAKSSERMDENDCNSLWSNENYFQYVKYSYMNKHGIPLPKVSNGFFRLSNWITNILVDSIDT